MSVAFGDRMRKLRVERGISQTELARDLVSPSYISLIEGNKRVPEREVVQALAERLGTTAGFLDSGVDAATIRDEELTLRYAELALANGQVAEALSQFDKLARDGRESRYPAAWGSARALEARGRLDEAIAQIEWLLVETRAGRATAPGLLILVTAQCRLYRLAGDLNRSVEVGEAAVQEMQELGLRGTEDEIRLVATLVSSYWERGDWTRADLLAQEVVRRAEAHGSRRSRGSAYWNASLIAESTGRVNLAVELAERALAMFAEGDDERSIAMLRSNYAWLLLRREAPDVKRAEEMLTRARDVFVRSGLETELAHCETELAAVALHQGRHQDAADLASSAIRRLDERAVLEVARAMLLRAHASVHLGRREDGLAEVAEATARLERVDAGRQAMFVWREIGDFFRSLGDADRALYAYGRLADNAGAKAGNLPSFAENLVRA